MKQNQLFVQVMALGLLFGLIGGALGARLFSASAPTSQALPSLPNQEAHSYVEAWQTASPAVVSVVALKDLTDYYARLGFLYTGGPQEVSSGTGFFVTPDGLIVTNNHVVQDKEAEYVVILNDGTELAAEVLDRDTLNDIALMRVAETREAMGDFPVLELADSDLISVGQPVLAIGNALGEFSNTTTAGIISAKDRQIEASNGNRSESLVNLIQTDAAVNFGNSGGPLVDLEGHLVGMNTAISTAGSGLAFAIPSNDIAIILASYQEFGRIARPVLGVRHVLVNESIQERFRLDEDYGALIIGDDAADLPAVLKNSSAEKAGLQDGDVILSVDGKKINADFTLGNALASHLVGESIQLRVWRAGDTFDLRIELEEGA